MKKTVKLLSMLLALVMVAMCFAACGNTAADIEDENKAADTGAENNAEDTNDTEDDNVLVMGTNASFPPYEYVENGEIVGIDADIAAAIAEKLGMTLKIEDMPFDSIISSVQSGLVDVGIAGMTVNEERLENVNFSTSYATGVQAVIVKEGSEIASIDDLAGKKIGVQLATTGDIYATDDFGDDLVEQYNTGNDAVVALKEGLIDAVIIDNEPAKAYVAANEGLTILDTEYAVEDYAIAVNKENTELLDKINTALEELIDDGVIDDIIAKYITAE